MHMEGANWKLTTAKDIVEMTPKVELLEVSLLKKKKNYEKTRGKDFNIW